MVTQRRYDGKLRAQCAFAVKNVLISIPRCGEAKKLGLTAGLIAKVAIADKQERSVDLTACQAR